MRRCFCIPASVLAAAGSDLYREDELLSWAVADSFHIPSLALVLRVLLQSVCTCQCHPYVSAPWYPFVEKKIAGCGSWHSFRAKLLPGFSRLLDANDLARRMLRRCDLEEVQVPRSQRQLALALAQVPLVDLQIFWVHTQLHHMPPSKGLIGSSRKRFVAQL